MEFVTIKVFINNNDEHLRIIKQFKIYSEFISYSNFLSEVDDYETVWYLNDDGCQIFISSEKDLKTAIQNSSSVLRLYVIPKEKDWKIICTQCNQTNENRIYKCVICPNIAVCGRCEAFGAHENHDLLRISRKNTHQYSTNFFSKISRLYEEWSSQQGNEKENNDIFDEQIIRSSLTKDDQNDKQLNDSVSIKDQLCPSSSKTFSTSQNTPLNSIQSKEETFGSLQDIRKKIDQLLEPLSDNLSDIVSESSSISSSPFDLVEVNYDVYKSSEASKPSFKDEHLEHQLKYFKESTIENKSDGISGVKISSKNPNKDDFENEKNLDPVSRSVELMKSMGFSDKDGTLSQLLALKHGNIEQVLDLLSPLQ